MLNQPDLFEKHILQVAKANANVLSKEFMHWLPDNLHIWDAFVAQAMLLVKRGRSHYSAYTIVEFLRHHSAVSETGPGLEWKINNNVRPYLPRLFDAAYPQHAGLFEYRLTTKEKAS